MKNNITSNNYARIVGLLYLTLFFLGPLAFFMGRTSIVMPGDPIATIDALKESELMFRIGMVAESLIVLIEILVSGMLYVLLKRVNQAVALASSLARFGQSMLQAVNLFTAVPALLFLSGATYFTNELDYFVLLFADINAFIIMIWGILFGFHLLLLGYLVFNSRFWPKFLGVLLLLGGAGYLAQSYGHLLVPQYDAVMSTVVIVLAIPGELAFTLWLLIKGVDDEGWQQDESIENSFNPS